MSQAALATPVARPPRWLAPFLATQNWRIWSGSILFTFVSLHFLNHALGIFGVEAMEAMQAWRRALWRSAPGTALLYGAATVHVAFAVARVVARRSWRMPIAEAVQILLGFSIPFLVHTHITATRGLYTAFGVDDSYTHELRLLWPGYGWYHSLLLLIVWTHAIIGLHSVLSPRPWWPRWRDAAVAAAILVPAFALAGWISAGREILKRKIEGFPVTREQFFFARDMERLLDLWLWAALAAIVATLLVIALVRVRAKGISIGYLGARRIKIAPGPTLLEISRINGIAHASVCGGRARCSTCRVRIVEGAADLGPPSERERKVLERIGAPPGVRLACSIAPQRDLTVELLVVPSEARESLSARRDDSRWGVERRITVLFADLRGFTTLSERHLAYDVVFLLNRYLALMREAVENNGGQVDKFLGDGVLALFGTSGEADAGSTAALRAASGMFAAIKILNDEFSALVGQQLLMGVGIHTGSVILGKVGSTGSASGMTALGDTVNTASRLQDATKVLNCSLCVSEVAVMAAGLQFDPSLRRDVSVRGKAQTVAAYALDGSQPLPTADASAPTAAQT